MKKKYIDFSPIAHHNTVSIKKFYETIGVSNLESITDERAEEIFAEVENSRAEFIAKAMGFFTLQCLTAERMTTSPKNYNINTDEEKIVFYVYMLDKYLQVLDIFSECIDKEEGRTILKQKFGVYDPRLIKYEKMYNDRFNIRDIDNKKMR